MYILHKERPKFDHVAPFVLRVLLELTGLRRGAVTTMKQFMHRPSAAEILRSYWK